MFVLGKNSVVIETTKREFERVVYNAKLLSPGKVESKSSIGGGFTYLLPKVPGDASEHCALLLTSDDLLFAQIPIMGTLVSGSSAGLLLSNSVLLGGLQSLADIEDPQLLSFVEVDHPYDVRFLQDYWVDHVYEAINGKADPISLTGVRRAPERGRKLALIKPQGGPLDEDFVEWADRDILRWKYADVSGVMVLIETRRA